MRVAIDARLATGSAGGVQTLVNGLLSGLATLPPEGDTYDVVVYDDADSWLPTLPPDRFMIHHIATPRSMLGERVRDALPRPVVRTVRRVRRLSRTLSTGTRAPRPVPYGDPVVERLHPDVIHFPLQSGFLTSVPTVYQPHDLLHVHFPELLPSAQIADREQRYRALCADAAAVVVVSSWVRDDVTRHFDLDNDRVVVVPLAPLSRPAEPGTPLPAQLRNVTRRPYALYPAATWPHKNHLRLVLAIAALRDRGIEVPLVCTGAQNAHYESIATEIRRLRLGDLVDFVGFVPDSHLGALYAAARIVVVPTLYEAGSFPLWEAFQAGVPATCASVTSLPVQAGDAAVLFDPTDVDAIATAMQRVWTDETLRRALVAEGYVQVRRFTWPRTARLYRTVYRLAAGQSVDPQALAELRQPADL